MSLITLAITLLIFAVAFAVVVKVFKGAMKFAMSALVVIVVIVVLWMLFGPTNWFDSISALVVGALPWDGNFGRKMKWNFPL